MNPLDITDFYGNVSTLIIAIIAGFFIFKGLFPSLYRLGIHLSKRQLAVFAEPEAFDSIKETLVNSNLFSRNNVIRISKDSISSAEKYTLFLVHYPSYQDTLEKIIEQKSNTDALVIYAPSGTARVSEAHMVAINKLDNALVVNMKGRLLNDVLSCMITTPGPSLMDMLFKK